MPAGRPSIYSDELAERILDALCEGKSLVEICKADDMPGLRTVMKWAAEKPEFQHSYAHAREAQAEHMDHLILTTAAMAHTDPQGARVKVDAYKWRAAKLAPKRFGDKLDVTSGGDKIQNEASEVTKFSRLAAMAARMQDEPSDDAG